VDPASLETRLHPSEWLTVQARKARPFPLNEVMAFTTFKQRPAGPEGIVWRLTLDWADHLYRWGLSWELA
jgi:hypothetical protein